MIHPTAVVLGTLLLLAAGAPAEGQVRLGTVMGAYDLVENVDTDVHSLHLAVGARAGVRVVGPFSVEGEALHVPAKSDRRTADLFAYRATLMTRLLDRETVDPFLLVGAGWQQWRRWVGSDSEPDRPRFAYDKGAGYLLGLGAVFGHREPLRFRVDLRYEYSDFPTPAHSAFMGALGFAVEL